MRTGHKAAGATIAAALALMGAATFEVGTAKAAAAEVPCTSIGGGKYESSRARRSTTAPATATTGTAGPCPTTAPGAG